MSIANNGIDLAFEGAGTKPGLEIWCVDDLRLVPIPGSDHGKFYTGNAYVVLNTFLPKIGAVEYNIHYWLGEDANEVASALASDKALELDTALGSCAVQYREIQSHETEKFLSYFKPCIIPIKGVYSSWPGKVSEAYKISLLMCKGDHAVSVKEVPFSRSSLNHDNVFILDTAAKIFLFSGCNSTTQERAKALDIVQYIKENKHGGKCEIASVEDGKFVGDSDVGEFWSFFGGYAPIPKDSTSFAEKQIESSSRQLFWITLQGKLSPRGDEPLTREMLESSKCYMLDCGSEIFVWMGKQTSVTERKTSVSAIEKVVRNQGRSSGTHLTLLTEGLENSLFRSYFKNWPQVVETKLYDDGREKVAAIFKQQGFNVKELPNEEDYQPCINCQGKIKVWRVNGEELFPVPLHEQTKLFSGDCYIVQYTYPRDGKDVNLFYAWFGRDSVQEDRASAISHISTTADSTKENASLAQIHQDKEPRLFFLIFQTLIFFKGGSSKAYKKFLEENGFVDETYDENKTALFRVQGTSPENMQAIQVNLVSSSLNSSYCYIFQIGSSIFTWIGNLSSTANQALLDRMLDQINPTWQAVSVREGSEPDIFWDSLGGKTEYPREKEIRRHVEDPCLFVVTSADGDFKVKEIHSFTQDDLTTEDVLILDCQEEIYVWVGLHTNARSKTQALSLGQKFLETHLPVERPSPGAPIYVVIEGQEPPFFTQFFEWDSAKANMIGNSFERKLAILKGSKGHEIPQRSSRKPSSREPSPVGLRSKSVTSNGRRNSLSPASGPSDSKSNTSNNRVYGRPPLFSSKFSPGSITPESKPRFQNGNKVRVDSSDSSPIPAVYPYKQLRVDSTSPLKGINVSKREAYLPEEEFQEKFGMTKQAFYELPRWRQNKLKLAVNLF